MPRRIANPTTNPRSCSNPASGSEMTRVKRSAEAAAATGVARLRARRKALKGANAVSSAVKYGGMER